MNQQVSESWEKFSTGKAEEFKRLNLANDDVLENVVELPVAQLVAEHGEDLIVVAASLLAVFALLVLVSFLPFGLVLIGKE